MYCQERTNTSIEHFMSTSIRCKTSVRRKTRYCHNYVLPQEVFQYLGMKQRLIGQVEKLVTKYLHHVNAYSVKVSEDKTLNNYKYPHVPVL